MKVGILTFHRGPNYGGFLQAWCLRQAIRELGHDAEIINYKNETHFHHELRVPKRSVKLRRMLREWKRRAIERERRAAFEAAYPLLAEGAPVTSASEIAWNRFDAVVVGSDVVWDHGNPKYGSDPAYFGIVPGEPPGRWVAYAASCGKASTDASSLDRKKQEGMRGFSAVGVRDRFTRNLVHDVTGQTPPLVVDPTWLPLRERPWPMSGASKTLAVYGYAGMPGGVVAGLRAYAKKNGLRVVSYGYYHPWADECRAGLNPFEWVEAIAGADALVTGTFHGTLYAILLGKRFVTVESEWISHKVTAPLELLGLTDRLTSSGQDVERILEAQRGLDGAAIFEKAGEARANSLDFLRNALAS